MKLFDKNNKGAGNGDDQEPKKGLKARASGMLSDEDMDKVSGGANVDACSQGGAYDIQNSGIL